MRILFISLLLLTAYQLLIWSGLVAPGIGRDNYQLNVITAERWRYRGAEPKAVIVGSSKINFLDYDVLGKDVAHMGFGALGCLTGLKILNDSKQAPELILVEMDDKLQWPSAKRYLQIGTATEFRAGDIFSALRNEYELPEVMLAVFKNMIGKSPIDPNLREKCIQAQIELFSGHLLDNTKESLTEHAKQAQELIDSLESKGSRVVLFDPPGESAVAQTRFIAEAKAFVEQLFDRHSHTWLVNPPGPWTTRDGIHLEVDSASSYSRWLRDQIDEQLKERSSKLHQEP
jgi:hypothetical protein